MAAEGIPAEESHPVALAFAVAALQQGSAAFESAVSIPQTLDSKSPKQRENDHVQQPGSGSDSNETRDSVTASADRVMASVSVDDEDAEKRLARSRERNREHARRTRLRKKAQLEALQSRVKGLEAERQVLRQSIEECSIASILLGLSSGEQDDSTQGLLEPPEKGDSKAAKVALLACGKRKRFLSDAGSEMPSKPLRICIDGENATIGSGKSHLNWKTGVYIDENGVQKQLTSDQLEGLRRERNRMHAKMTRDRRKCFISTIEKTIEELENDVHRMRAVLAKVSSAKFSQMVTPVTSPELSGKEGPALYNDDSSVYSEAANEDTEFARKPIRHGFSLDS